MKIAIDLDGVVGNFDAAAAAVVNARYPGRVPDDFEPATWYWEPVLEKSDWDWIWNDIRKVNNFWLHLPPIAENMNALRLFFETERNHEVYFVTSRSVLPGETVPLQTERWLLRHRIHPHNNYMAIIAVPEPELKFAVCHDLGIPVSIDDLGPTVKRLNDLPGHTSYVLDRGYNRDQNYGPRVYNLQQYFDVILGKKKIEDFYS